MRRASVPLRRPRAAARVVDAVGMTNVCCTEVGAAERDRSETAHAAERRNLRSPRREPWDLRWCKVEPRSGDTCAVRPLQIDGVRICRRSAARVYSRRLPKAHALGYVDCAAPRRPGDWALKGATECVAKRNNEGTRGG